MPFISIIAAVDRNMAIGFQNKLLFWLPNDLKRFKALTTGNTIIMGRKTFESLPKGALPNRRNVVLSTNPKAEFLGAEVFSSLEAALKSCNDNEHVYIIGGESIYRQAIDVADELCLTEIDGEAPEADAFFPMSIPPPGTKKAETPILKMRNISAPMLLLITVERKTDSQIICRISPKSYHSIRICQYTFPYRQNSQQTRDITTRHLPFDSLMEGDQCFRARQPQRLQFIMNHT